MNGCAEAGAENACVEAGAAAAMGPPGTGMNGCADTGAGVVGARLWELADASGVMAVAAGGGTGVEAGVDGEACGVGLSATGVAAGIGGGAAGVGLGGTGVAAGVGGGAAGAGLGATGVAAGVGGGAAGAGLGGTEAAGTGVGDTGAPARRWTRLGRDRDDAVYQDAALRDDQLGLLQHHRRHLQSTVDERADQRDPARAADQEHAGELFAREPGVPGDACGQPDRLVEQRAGQRLELLARDVRVQLHAGKVQVGRGVAGQSLLHDADVLTEQAALPALRGGRGLGQAPPAVRVARPVHCADPLDQLLVEVEPADVVASVDRPRAEPAGGTFDQAGVERAAAEVVHDHGAADRHPVAEHLREVRRRGHRLLDHPDVAEPGPYRGVQQDPPARGAPGRGAGHRHDVQTLPGGAYRLGADDRQHRRDHGGDRQRPVAEEDRPLVDPPLWVGLEPARVQPRAVQRVAPDEQLPGGVQVHGRGQQRGTVEQQWLCPAIGPTQYRHRVRRPEVDTEPEPCSLHIGTVGPRCHGGRGRLAATPEQASPPRQLAFLVRRTGLGRVRAPRARLVGRARCIRKINIRALTP